MVRGQLQCFLTRIYNQWITIRWTGYFMDFVVFWQKIRFRPPSWIFVWTHAHSNQSWNKINFNQFKAVKSSNYYLFEIELIIIMIFEGIWSTFRNYTYWRKQLDALVLQLSRIYSFENHLCYFEASCFRNVTTDIAVQALRENFIRRSSNWTC